VPRSFVRDKIDTLCSLLGVSSITDTETGIPATVFAPEADGGKGEALLEVCTALKDVFKRRWQVIKTKDKGKEVKTRLAGELQALLGAKLTRSVTKTGKRGKRVATTCYRLQHDAEVVKTEQKADFWSI
jgi:hypothetical protein